MSSSNRQYVIRGYTAPKPGISPGALTQLASSRDRAEDQQSLPLAALAKLIRPPVLADEIPLVDVNRLHLYLPTLSWLDAPAATRPRCRLPLQFLELLTGSREKIPTQFKAACARYKTIRRQTEEIGTLIELFESQYQPELLSAKIQSSLPVAVTTQILGRIGWPNTPWSTLFESATREPFGAWIMAHHHLSSEAEWLQIRERVQSDPRLVYALARLHHLPADIFTPQWYLEQTASRPTYNFLLRWELDGRCRTEARIREDILCRAKIDAESAMLALVLEPRHPEAPHWLARIPQSPAWAYEAASHLNATAGPDSWSKLGDSLKVAALRDPYFGFLWYRDIEPENAILGVQEICPSIPWMMELTAQTGIDPSTLAAILADLAEDSEGDPWLELARTWCRLKP